MEYLSGKDYPHLCEECRREVDAVATSLQVVQELRLADDAGEYEDAELPIMRVYDGGRFCGGRECVGGTEALAAHLRGSMIAGGGPHTFDQADEETWEMGNTSRAATRRALKLLADQGTPRAARILAEAGATVAAQAGGGAS